MQIEQNKSLRFLNTFGIEAQAKFFVEIRSVDDFQELARDARFSGEKKLVLGGGSTSTSLLERSGVPLYRYVQ